MVGRNDPCPCGSGKKYKKCCERKDAVTVEDLLTDEMEHLLQTFLMIFIPSDQIYLRSWNLQIHGNLH